jgi:hypothetical protein
MKIQQNFDLAIFGPFAAYFLASQGANNSYTFKRYVKQNNLDIVKHISILNYFLY